MRQSKILIVILVLIVLLFGLTLGLSYAQSQRQPVNPQTYAQDGRFPNWIGGMADLLAPFSPKVQLESATTRIEPGDKLTIAPATPAVLFQLPRSDRPFRIAKFELMTGERVSLLYRDRTGNAAALNLQEQTLDLPRKEGSHPQRGAIVILREGGMLQITCPGATTCQVALQ